MRKKCLVMTDAEITEAHQAVMARDQALLDADIGCLYETVNKQDSTDHIIWEHVKEAGIKSAKLMQSEQSDSSLGIKSRRLIKFLDNHKLYLVHINIAFRAKHACLFRSFLK